MRFAVDGNGFRVCIDDASRIETYFCQECGEKLVQRRGEIKIHHFAHYPNTHCRDVWHYDETDWHAEMESLFPKECQEIVFEKGETKHRADVFIQSRGVVVEFQKNRLNAGEFKERNEFFTSLGHRVIWVFHEALNFQSEAIEPYGHEGRQSRKWKNPSRAFKGFLPSENIEVWFQRDECDDPNQKAFFQIDAAGSAEGFKVIECGHLYSRDELIRYLLEGKHALDKTLLWEEFNAIRRSDASDSIYGCPLSDEPFVPIEKCVDCPHCVLCGDNYRPYFVRCNYRPMMADLSSLDVVSKINHREDGFLTEIIGGDVNGEVVRITFDPPKSALRTLGNLWKKYRPLQYIYCYNAKTKEIFSVFNPDWLKANRGSVTGFRANADGRKYGGKVEIEDADEPIWFVVGFLRP